MKFTNSAKTNARARIADGGALLCLLLSLLDVLYLVYARLLRNLKLKELARRRRIEASGPQPALELPLHVLSHVGPEEMKIVGVVVVRAEV